MNVTKNVVKDLLPVYVSDEASADTRALVEAFAASDPEFARELAVIRAGTEMLPPTAPPATSAEKLALEETRRLLKTRTSTLAVAVVFTLLPLSFVVRDARITFLLVRDAPAIAAAWWLTAAVMWTWHFAIRRRLRVTGL